VTVEALECLLGTFVSSSCFFYLVYLDIHKEINYHIMLTIHNDIQKRNHRNRKNGGYIFLFSLVPLAQIHVLPRCLTHLEYNVHNVYCIIDQRMHQLLKPSQSLPDKK